MSQSPIAGGDVCSFGKGRDECHLCLPVNTGYSSGYRMSKIANIYRSTGFPTRAKISFFKCRWAGSLFSEPTLREHYIAIWSIGSCLVLNHVLGTI